LLDNFLGLLKGKWFNLIFTFACSVAGLSLKQLAFLIFLTHPETLSPNEDPAAAVRLIAAVAAWNNQHTK